MSSQNVIAFRQRLANDPDLQAKVRESSSNVDGILAAAASVGLPFTGADLGAHVADPAANASELSDFEIEMVAGGTQFNGFAQQLQCGTTTC